MVKNENRLDWIDSIRVMATFMVVLLHSASPLLHRYQDLPLGHWMTGNIYDSLVRVSVPLFFMVSGALLLRKDEPITTFLQKRLTKILVPFLFWSLFFIFWNARYEHNTEVILWSYYSILFIPSYYHLWFLYAIIGLYLYVPILRKLIRNCDSRLLIYYLFLWFLAVSIIPLGESIIGLHSRIDLLSISGYTGYLVLGYMLSRYEYSRIQAMGAFSLYVLCALFASWGTYSLTVKNQGVYDGYYFGYLTPNVILGSASFFIFLKYVALTSRFALKAPPTRTSRNREGRSRSSCHFVQEFTRNSLRAVVGSLSDCSFGIYLVHTIFLSLLKKGALGLTLSAFSGPPVYCVPLTATVTFTLSYLMVLLLRQIPMVRKIVP